MKLSQIVSQQAPGTRSPQVPYVIAEAGVNHECDMNIALRLIDEAKEGGADAIKFQSYKASSLASKNSPAYWDLSKEPTKTQRELFSKYDSFSQTDFQRLKVYCDDVGIEFMSTPFDIDSADFLNDLMSVFKISSSDMNNKPFIDAICKYGKPIILSTGASYLWEIEQSVSWVNEKNIPISLLHCMLNYPTEDINANLEFIRILIHKFPNHAIGYSDHTMPNDMKTLEVAALLGAKIIEKHFTHDKTLPGNDHYHAMDKNDLIKFRESYTRVIELLGSGNRSPLDVELSARKNARRSLVINRKITKHSNISPMDLTWKRPAAGIDPREYDSVLNMKAARDLEEDTILQWSDLYKTNH